MSEEDGIREVRGSSTEGLLAPAERQTRKAEVETSVETSREESSEETVLSDKERAQFKDLLTIGRHSKSFSVLGHPVTLSTMTVAQELLVGRAASEYRGTEGFARAYQSAVVASSVKELSGEPFYVPLSPDESEAYVFQKRLEKVHKLYPLVVSEIYKNYLEMEKEFAELAKKLGKLDG